MPLEFQRERGLLRESRSQLFLGALGLLPYVVTTTPQFLKDVTNSNIVILKPVLNQKTGHTEHTAVQSGGFQNKERLGD